MSSDITGFVPIDTYFGWLKSKLTATNKKERIKLRFKHSTAFPTNWARIEQRDLEKDYDKNKRGS